ERDRAGLRASDGDPAAAAGEGGCTIEVVRAAAAADVDAGAGPAGLDVSDERDGVGVAGGDGDDVRPVRLRDEAGPRDRAAAATRHVERRTTGAGERAAARRPRAGDTAEIHTVRAAGRVDALELARDRAARQIQRGSAGN